MITFYRFTTVVVTAILVLLVMLNLSNAASPSNTIPQEIRTLSLDNQAFAIDLYAQLRMNEGNLLFSPYSISSALAMSYVGAVGNTAREMAHVLHFSLPDDLLHRSFQTMNDALTSREREIDTLDLNIANALWGQQGFPFQEVFVDLVRTHYRGHLHPLDFERDTQGAREEINRWVARETNERIEELIAPGVLTTDTRLVLTNAIHFKAAWATPFYEGATSNRPFTLLSGDQLMVPTMQTQATFGYVTADTYQAVALPYQGRALSLVAVLPNEGGFSAFEKSLDAALLEQITTNLSSTRLRLYFPKFTFTSDFDLTSTLASLGMQDAFRPGTANFSRIDGSRELFIGAVVHEAFIAVDEEGTEVAAATAIEMGVTSAPVEPPREVRFDRPFVFFIYDHETEALLFLGRVVNPQG